MQPSQFNPDPRQFWLTTPTLQKQREELEDYLMILAADATRKEQNKQQRDKGHDVDVCDCPDCYPYYNP